MEEVIKVGFIKEEIFIVDVSTQKTIFLVSLWFQSLVYTNLRWIYVRWAKYKNFSKSQKTETENKED